jgi:hypothetical protein
LRGNDHKRSHQGWMVQVAIRPARQYASTSEPFISSIPTAAAASIKT